MFCSMTVLPVRGGATMRARWPLPSGEIRSMMRVVTSARRLGIAAARLLRSMRLLMRPEATASALAGASATAAAAADGGGAAAVAGAASAAAGRRLLAPARLLGWTVLRSGA